MKESIYRLIMMFGLYLGLILFVLAGIILVKNIKEIQTDPMIYGMEKHGFETCACTQPGGVYTIIEMLDSENISELGVEQNKS